MNKKIIGVIIGALIIMGAIVAFIAINPFQSETINAVEGRVLDVAPSVKTVLIEDGSGREIILALTGATKLLDENGETVILSYVRRGFSVRAEGTETENVMIPGSVQVIKAPNIVVFAPRAGDEIDLPVIIEGEARVFENQLNVRIKDEDGTTLTERGVTAQSEDVGLYGPFEIHLSYPEPKGNKGTIETFDYSAKDGSEIDKAVIPVLFGETSSTEVQVFFGNENEENELFDCTAVHPVKRRVLETDALARAALEELLKGPDRIEADAGYSSSINTGVTIQSVVIEDGTVNVDFSSALEDQVGGSCRVTAIRAQITETLKQFSTVDDVVISIDGRTEDILQP